MFKLFVSFCLVFSVASVSNGQSLTDLKKQSKTNLDLLAQRILGRGTGNAFLDLLKNDQVLVELRVDESQRTELYEGFREIIEVRDELTSLATENKSMSHEVVRLIKANDSLLLKIEVLRGI